MDDLGRLYLKRCYPEISLGLQPSLEVRTSREVHIEDDTQVINRPDDSVAHSD